MSNLKKLPPSPVTGSQNVRIVDEFSSEKIVELYKLQENIDVEKYFRHGDTVHLLECTDTGYRFFYPFEVIGDEEFYRNLQAAHEQRGLEYDQQRPDEHGLAFENIKPNDKVLEIGCNSGKFLEEVAKITRNIQGLEFNALAAERARQKGFEITGESIEKHADENAEKYDVVCAFQVLEHVTEIRSFVTASLKSLKKNGKLIFSVPNNEPYFQRFGKYEVLNLPPHHVGLWNIAAFQKMCGFYNIELIDHKLIGDSPILVDAFLRAKMLAGVTSLPRRQTLSEKLKIYSVAPFTVLRSSLDYLGGNPNHSFLTAVFRKN